MAFNNETLRKALEVKAEQRKSAELRLEALKEKALKDEPHLAELEVELKMKSSAFALLSLSGDTSKISDVIKELDELNACRRKLLKALNVPEAPQYTCSKCNDTGYQNGVLCTCVKELAAKSAYKKLIGEMPLEGSTFETFDLSLYPEEKNSDGISPRKQMTAVVRSVKKFIEEFPSGGNLLLMGKSGLGKTHLSLAVANEMIGKGYGVIYGSAQNLINEISRESFDRSGSTEKIDSLTSCDLLIMDDLGTEFSTQLSASIVYNIINTRLLRGLSTVISTNLTFKEIGDFYHDRITSRLIGSYTVCPCFGNDIRQIKSVNNK